MMNTFYESNSVLYIIIINFIFLKFFYFIVIEIILYENNILV